MKQREHDALLSGQQFADLVVQKLQEFEAYRHPDQKKRPKKNSDQKTNTLGWDVKKGRRKKSYSVTTMEADGFKAASMMLTDDNSPKRRHQSTLIFVHPNIVQISSGGEGVEPYSFSNRLPFWKEEETAAKQKILDTISRARQSIRMIKQ